MRLIGTFAALFLAWGTAFGQGQEAAQLTRQLDQTVLFQDVAISADGQRVAWVQTTAGGTAAVVQRLLRNEPNAKAGTVKAGGDANRRDTSPAWSPDGKSLAFFSNAGSGEQMQLWMAGESGPARKRTKLAGYADRLRWSPDATRIAFLYTEGGGGGGPLSAAPVQTGVIEAEIHNQRIAVMDVSSGDVRQVSPSNLNVYDFDWSPDSSRFVVTAAPGPGDNNWWIARIHTIDIASGQAKELYRPALQVAVPRWSPDGKQVAFLEGLMSDEGFHGGDVFTISAEGGKAINRTPGRKSSPSSVRWIGPDRLLFTEWIGGGSGVSTLDLRSGVSETVWKGDYSIHSDGNFPNAAFSKDGRTAAIVHTSFTEAPEVWAGPVGDWKVVTHNNASQAAAWGPGENLEWTSDGQRVQGWLLTPRKPASARRSPLVVFIHGGPSGVARQSWPAEGSLPVLLASQGYYVLFPNPRGSYGQGEAFTQANVKDFGGGDLRDILAGVDHVLSHYPVDPQRLGVTGWSYGGYMTMWTVTQTNRFRAAMAGAGIANWRSYYGENLIDQWMIPFFGASVYDDPAVYEKSSPIRFIRNVKTPTLVLVGERDAECPAPQSFEFWHALKTLGVPTELVVYAGEGHRFEKPKNRVDMQERTLAWFNKFLQP